MSTWPGEEEARYQERPQEPEPTQNLPQYPPPSPPPPGYGQPMAYGQPNSYGQPMMYNQVQPHSAGIAVLASFFVPGLGSMLNEKVGKGVGILACYIVAVILCFVLVGFIVAPAVWIWGMVAGNNDANQWNRQHGILS